MTPTETQIGKAAVEAQAASELAFETVTTILGTCKDTADTPTMRSLKNGRKAKLRTALRRAGFHEMEPLKVEQTR